MCLNVHPHSVIFNYVSHDVQPTFDERTSQPWHTRALPTQNRAPHPSYRCLCGQDPPLPVNISRGSILIKAFGLFPRIQDNQLSLLVFVQLVQLLPFDCIWWGFVRGNGGAGSFVENQLRVSADEKDFVVGREGFLKKCCFPDSAFSKNAGDPLNQRLLLHSFI